MIEEMGGRLGTLTGELTDRGAFDLVVKTGIRNAHEVERMAMYESRFKETIDYVMLRALDKSVAARTDAALGKRSTEESTLPKVCVIHYCPDGEPKDEAQDEFAVRVTNNMTFRDLRVNAARQHGPTVAGSPALAAARRSSLPAGSGRPSCSPQRSGCAAADQGLRTVGSGSSACSRRVGRRGLCRRRAWATRQPNPSRSPSPCRRAT